MRYNIFTIKRRGIFDLISSKALERWWRHRHPGPFKKKQYRDNGHPKEALYVPLLHIIRKGYNMWNIDLSFLQESAQIFLDEFVHKYYRIYTKSGQVFLVIFKWRKLHSLLWRWKPLFVLYYAYKKYRIYVEIVRSWYHG